MTRARSILFGQMLTVRSLWTGNDVYGSLPEAALCIQCVSWTQSGRMEAIAHAHTTGMTSVAEEL